MLLDTQKISEGNSGTSLMVVRDLVGELFNNPVKFLNLTSMAVGNLSRLTMVVRKLFRAVLNFLLNYLHLYFQTRSETDYGKDQPHCS